jgi:hypothetical protein
VKIPRTGDAAPTGANPIVVSAIAAAPVRARNRLRLDIANILRCDRIKKEPS